ncbi:hypothetical protein SIN8267_00337 [Sinobacterium norvegicum]|uniref:KfrA N-terminal DNA-binding domain-containing protein n=1 Tax=Sinobacterium norvegicum TaxID=1641715 RepID=A0ABM9AAL1_9GAMM|nr:DNA-binding protein [Sinobacterium norvegicum]CAH0990245.1 hypothetical protein SIN8267_00337 [Sinobacterium norvegicum]
MARAPAIGIADVEKAKHALLSQGVTVNPYQIRQLIGRGSYDTIEKYLRALSLTTDNEQQSEDRLSKSLAEMVRPLAQELTRQNKDRLTSLSQQHREQLNIEQDKNRQLSVQNTELSSCNAQQQCQIETLSEQLAAATQRQQTTEEQQQQSHQRAEVLAAEQRQLLQRINEAERRLKDSRDDQRQQLEQLNKQHRDSLQSEQMKADELQRQCHAKEQRISDELNKSLLLAERTVTLSSEIGSLNSALTECHTKLKHTTDELHQNASQHQIVIDGLNEDQTKLVSELKNDHRQRLDDLKDNHLAHAASLSDRVADFKQQNSLLNNENRQLTRQIEELRRHSNSSKLPPNASTP